MICQNDLSFQAEVLEEVISCHATYKKDGASHSTYKIDGEFWSDRLSSDL